MLIRVESKRSPCAHNFCMWEPYAEQQANSHACYLFVVSKVIVMSKVAVKLRHLDGFHKPHEQRGFICHLPSIRRFAIFAIPCTTRIYPPGSTRRWTIQHYCSPQPPQDAIVLRLQSSLSTGLAITKPAMFTTRAIDGKTKQTTRTTPKKNYRLRYHRIISNYGRAPQYNHR